MKKLFLSLYVLPLFCVAAPVEWESTHYIWNFGLIQCSNKGLTKRPREYFFNDYSYHKSAYQNMNAGDIVWIRGRFLQNFCEDILPALNKPIVLLIADGDESFPSNCGKEFYIHTLLANPYIVHVFAQNNEITGNSKVTSIPIGIDFHTIAYKGSAGGWGEKGLPSEQELKLSSILKELKPTYLRKKRIYVDFHLSDTMHGEFKRYLQFGEDRKKIFEVLLRTNRIDYSSSFMRRSELWKKKGEYAFSVSPHGNGLDCHRTWEDLALGCIVIVKTSPLDQLYEGLPVIIVKDWSEITTENLDKWIEQYGDAFANPCYREKLTHAYWFSKIEAVAQKYRIR